MRRATQTKVKICGLTRDCDINYVNEVRPDYVGFVFAKGKKMVSAEQVIEFERKLDKSIKVVGVFEDAPLEMIEKLLNRGVIHIAQLQGNEDSAYIQAVRGLSGRPVIKVVKVESERDIIKANRLPADYLLFEINPSGNSKNFSWDYFEKAQKAVDFRDRKPFFIGGNLNESNIEKAIEKTKAYAVDLTSCLETDGLKDRDKMVDMLKLIREEEEAAEYQ